MEVFKARSAKSTLCTGRSGIACSAVFRGAKPARRGGLQADPWRQAQSAVFPGHQGRIKKEAMPPSVTSARAPPSTGCRCPPRSGDPAPVRPPLLPHGKHSAQVQRAGDVRDQSRMAVTRHEARGNAREPDGGTPGRRDAGTPDFTHQSDNQWASKVFPTYTQKPCFFVGFCI